MSSSTPTTSWSAQFRAETAPIIAEPFLACLAEAIATVESAAGTRAIHGPLVPASASLPAPPATPDTPLGLNEIGYKAVPGKPYATIATHEAAATSQPTPNAPLQSTTARFRLFRDRAEQAAGLLFLLRGSAFYESARLLFVLTFYAAYAPGRTAGARELVRVFNRLAASGVYPGLRPFAMLTPASADADTLALNHAAARDALHLFADLTRTP
jgi:hypothetical protein